MSIQLKQLADSSVGLEGAGLDTGSFIFVNIPYNTASPLTLSSFVLPRQCVVQAIYAVTDAASTNAVTATVYKAPSATALGSGTALHSGTISLQATAATNVIPTLAASSTLLVSAGNRIGIVISGALGAAGSGVVTVALTPA
jgi:hypothetical protein